MKKTAIKIVSIMLVAVALAFSLLSCTKKNYDAIRLNNAICDKDIERVRSLLEKGVDPNVPDVPFTIDSIIWYPLSTACYQGNYEIVKLLIDNGASAIINNSDAYSPMLAVLQHYQSETIPIVALLLENDGDTYCDWGGTKRKNDEARFYYIQMAASRAPSKYHNSESGKDNAYFEKGYDEESANGIVEVIKLLIGKMDHFDVNEGSYTLLMRAASTGNIALVKYLLSIGADKAIKNSDGNTAYDYAIDNAHVELAELLKP